MEIGWSLKMPLFFVFVRAAGNIVVFINNGIGRQFERMLFCYRFLDKTRYQN